MDAAFVVALLQPLCAGLAFRGPFALQHQVHVVGPAASNVGSAEIQHLNPDGSPRVRVPTGADFTLRTDDAYGTALARVGDLDLDGIAELAVGIPRAQHLGRQEPGEVRILFLDALGAVRSTTRITDPLAEVGEWFGSSLAGLGDLDGDGMPEIAVGHGWLARKVSILFLDPLGMPRSRHTIGGGNAGSSFGHALSAIGDLNGDGVSDLAVAEPDGPALWILFLRHDGTQLLRRKIAHTDPAFGGSLSTSDHFGYALAAPGDLDGDGVEDLLVGEARDDSGGATDSGAVWVVFLLSSGDVKSARKIDRSDGAPLLSSGDRFGSALASLGDLDGDSRIEVAVGAPGDSTESGRAWLLSLNPDGSVFAASSTTDATPEAHELFASSAASLGDVDGDGTTDLALGILGTDRGGSPITSLNQAVLDAAEGDVILVRAGDYPALTLSGKSLTLQAEAGHTANVGDTIVSGIGPLQSLRLQGLQLAFLRPEHNDGVVWVEDCSIDAGYTIPRRPGIFADDSAKLVLVHTTSYGAGNSSSPSPPAILERGAGLETLRPSSIHAYECSFIGGNGVLNQISGFWAPTPGRGVWSRDPGDYLFLSRCSLQGGNGLGCDVYPGNCRGVNGGTGLETLGATWLLDCVLIGGRASEGFRWDCGPYPNCGMPGVPQVGSVTSLAGNTVTGSVSSPVREGEALTVRVQAPPYSTVWAIIARQPEATSAPHPFVGTILTAMSPRPLERYLGVTDADGELERTIVTDPLPPGAESATYFWQFHTLEDDRIGANAHGVLKKPRYRLGTGAMVVVLDDAL